MRIYFGRMPEDKSGDGVKSLDAMFLDYLIDNDYIIENAVDAIADHLMDIWDGKNVIAHTLNPLIINFFTDDFAKEYLWMIDEEGNHINMGTDDHMLSKMDFLSPGEVMCDDYRSFTCFCTTFIPVKSCIR